MRIEINDSDVGVKKMSTLIRKLSFVFSCEGKEIIHCDFQITCQKLDSISALVIFKIFDFSLQNKCLKEPTANLEDILKLFSVYGIEKLMRRLISQEHVGSLYKNLKPISTKDFFIAPHPINRDNFSNKQDLDLKYTQFIADYYQNICPDLVQYFKTCICEIASNFLYHALEDKNSILMAQGTSQQIEIVCVDNSQGIISSLGGNKNKHIATMESAFERGVSSKKNNSHCGTGLWYVKKIVEQLNGTLRVHSEDISYICHGGKTKISESPFWKGSIFYVKLNIVADSNIDVFFDGLSEGNNLGLVTV